jgi:hypothetical protein
VTAGDVQLSYNPTLSNLSRTTTLRKCLTGMGATREALQLIRAPKLLGFLVDNASAVYQSLLQSMPTFLVQAGMAILTPDLDASTCDGTWTPTRQVAIAHANIVCEVAGLPTWGPFSIADINILIGGLTITATNTLSSSQQISFTGSATFSVPLADFAGVTLGLSCVLGTTASDLVFTISGTSVVSSLPALLPCCPACKTSPSCRCHSARHFLGSFLPR